MLDDGCDFGSDDGIAENLFVLIISWQFEVHESHDWLDFLGNLKVFFFKDHFLASVRGVGFKLIIQFSLSLFKVVKVKLVYRAAES